MAAVSGAPVYAPRKTCRILEREGVARGSLFNNEEITTIEWDETRVQVLPSRHIRFDAPLILETLKEVLRGGIFFDLAPLLKNYPAGSTSNFLIDHEGYRILFSGSGGGDWNDPAGVEPDCFLLPFAGRSDVTEYYLRALRILRPRTVVLHHFDEFFPHFYVEAAVEAFAERLSRELPEIRLVIPTAEEPFTLS